jgi:hypothetical protein
MGAEAEGVTVTSSEVAPMAAGETIVSLFDGDTSGRVSEIANRVIVNREST